jgi:hypothetical protein
VFAVLVVGGGADAADAAACERGLEHVRGQSRRRGPPPGRARRGRRRPSCPGRSPAGTSGSGSTSTPVSTRTPSLPWRP